MFQWNFKLVSRVFERSVKGVSEKFQGCLKFQGCRKFRMFQGSFMGVYRKFQGGFQEV